MHHRTAIRNTLVTALLLMTSLAAAQRQQLPLPPQSMPIREVTVFKDGHALVLHQGKMAIQGDQELVMDYLPTPVLGTFWPFTAQGEKAKLKAVVASQRRVVQRQTAMSIPELVRANLGKDVLIEEVPAGQVEEVTVYQAKILRLLHRTVEEQERNAPPNSGPKTTQYSAIVMLQTSRGTKALPMDRILSLTVLGEPASELENETFRNTLTMKLAGADKTAQVGLMYVQKGLRWIPNYKIDLDGEGQATVELQATLINELADLEGVTANLVVGVPNFAFADKIDPMGMQQSLANLSQHFRRDSQTAYGFSNAIMTQRAQAGGAYESAPRGGRAPNLGPEVGTGSKNEDLFVFPVDNITLAKGERMTIPIATYKLPYTEVHTLDIPFTPPKEIWRHFNSSQQRQLAEMYRKPKVQHKIRLTNESKAPITTAPALILLKGRVLAQTMSTYTPIKGEVDLKIGTAVDVTVKKSDEESKREPDAATFRGHKYMKVNLKGEIKLTNHKDKQIRLEVTRSVLGNVVSANMDGQTRMLNVFEDDSFLPNMNDNRPHWWGWYSWPWWWHHFNGVGQVEWDLQLKAGQSETLSYTWNYYWG
ncbi:MAG: hypothetical protein ACLFUJ_15265 [Phycisphaerae bacterium]